MPGDFIHLEQNEVTLDGERRITPEDVDDVMNLALDYKNKQDGVIIHRSPAWFTVDDRRDHGAHGLKGSVVKCMASFVIADATFLEDMQARMGEQDIHINGYLSPALGEALLLIPPEERDKVAVLVDVGYLSTEVMFVQGDALIRHEVLPMGGGHLAADLAMEFPSPWIWRRSSSANIPSASVRISLRHRPGRPERLFPQETVLAVIEPRVAELSDMVRDTIEKYASELSQRSTFYITGGGLILMRGGRETISAVVERTFKARPRRPPSSSNSPVYSSAIGLLELVYESVSQMEVKPPKAPARSVLSSRHSLPSKQSPF